jgi:hypothetical protein
MPAIATGVMLANRELIAIGVSGDGDTASIGMGQFVHLLRRNIPMIYIIENNGVYGLTKGQFSATADYGSKAKSGEMNDLPAIDVLHDGDRARMQFRGSLLCRGPQADGAFTESRTGPPRNGPLRHHQPLRHIQ